MESYFLVISEMTGGVFLLSLPCLVTYKLVTYQNYTKMHGPKNIKKNTYFKYLLCILLEKSVCVA